MLMEVQPITSTKYVTFVDYKINLLDKMISESIWQLLPMTSLLWVWFYQFLI